MNPWMQAAIAFASCGALFGVVFVLARRLDNYGIVDVAWSHAFGLLAVFYAASGTGWAQRRWLLAALVMTWSTRLGLHLWRRVAAHHPREDGRYQEMRGRWRDGFARRMFWFFQAQAVSVVVLGLPFLLPMSHAAAGFHPLELAGAAIWLLGLGGEAVADAQLRAFKSDPAHRGEVCAQGLWRYSRHPNYFFEWLVWAGYAVFALASPAGWLGLIAPAAMLHLLLNVTGVPPTEAQLVRSKGERYRHYQASTNAFFPGPPRRNAELRAARVTTTHSP